MAFKSIKEKIPLKVQLIIVAVMLLVLLVVYVCIDMFVAQDLKSTDSSIKRDSTYMIQFQSLLTNIENGDQTGIGSYDDKDLGFGDKVMITKGTGDFVNLSPSWKADVKSNTPLNTTNWLLGEDPGALMYSKEFFSNCTVYDRSGVTKLYDRYVLAAVGQYWADKFGIKEQTGATYKVFLDSGTTYDIVVCDLKANGDKLAVVSPDKLSIGHKAGEFGYGEFGQVCLTEFEVMNFDKQYPISNRAGKPTMDFNISKTKNDPSHKKTNGGFQVIPEFKGEVIAFQLIEDPKVTALIKKCFDDQKSNKSN